MKEKKVQLSGTNITKQAEVFFEKSPPDDIDPNENKRSDQEEDNLFNLDNVDAYIKHGDFKIRNLDRESERILREKNAKLVFRFSATWAVFIALIILLHGFGKRFDFFNLSQTEFLFVIGSLTTSIFTFYILVLKYLFYRKDKNTKK